jgi:MEDS: MEthanogen/methylotroph, DcmR Sensory domain
MAWGDFLRVPTCSDHAVQMYGDFSELADSAAAYLAAGFERGDMGIVVARDANVAMIADRLAEAGWGEERRDGALIAAGARETLDFFMQDGAPVPELFEEAVGGLLEEAERRRPGAHVRAFGEMVDILWEQDESRAAVRLEELWNALAKKRVFSLLCGYRFDVFDQDSLVEGLPSLIEVHSHVRPVAKPGLMSRAVDGALRDAVGDHEAAHIYLEAANEGDRKLPLAQAVLTWLTKHDPPLAGRVLPASRQVYKRAALTAQ